MIQARRAKRSILVICNFWHKAEDGPKDKQDFGYIYFCAPSIVWKRTRDERDAFGDDGINFGE